MWVWVGVEVGVMCVCGRLPPRFPLLHCNRLKLAWPSVPSRFARLLEQNLQQFKHLLAITCSLEGLEAE